MADRLSGTRIIKKVSATDRVRPLSTRRGGSNQLTRIMRFDRRSGSPSIDDQINSVPQRQVAVIARHDMREQSHPKRGQRFVVNVDSMMRRKAQERCSHSRGCFRQRHLFEVAQRHRQVRRVRELRWRDRARFKGCDEVPDLLVIHEITRLWRAAQGLNFPQRNKRARAQMTDMMNPAGWKEEPGAGFEKRRPIRPPTIDPPMPRSVVMMKPRCCTPGMTARATRPMMNPIMIDQMMCNIVFSVRPRGYQGGPEECH